MEHWAAGGETNLANLLLCCKTHHTLLHEGDFSVEGTGDAPLFWDPQGLLIEPCPELPQVKGDPVSVLSDHNRQQGLCISAETNRITWAGERIEWGWAVEALMPYEDPQAGTA